ncbi:glycosyltransferase family 2 protein [Candidatus Parcubacteria bacterium]|nr:MAG: glycosyltransferase family 2 protein [Candidatus Parcubacteria bacterium]
MAETEIKKLSIIIPAYNEIKTIEELIEKVEAVKLPLLKEIIVVDDCSTDGTAEVLVKLGGKKENLKIILSRKNGGKGSALKSGFFAATGDIIIIQDADLEYDPEEYGILIEPMLLGKADVVYGSRFFTGKAKRVLYFWHISANLFLTFLSNLLTGLTLTDMETGYKAFRREVVDSFKSDIRAKRFGIEPEITAKIAKGKWRIYEVGISYYGRTYTEGKKISWKDGIAAIWHIVRFNLFK